MLMFLARRLMTSVLVVLVSTVVMYVLVDIAIDPLEDLRTDTRPGAEDRIAARTAMLDLDSPVLLRYLDWLSGASRCLIGSCDLGRDWRTGTPTTELLSGAVTTTLQLVTVATLLAIVLGVFVGIVSALRQYSGFDYGLTFVSFVLYSLPTFWVAVLLKQFLAIKFNDFLADPQIAWWFHALVVLGTATVVMAAVGGSAARRLRVFGVAALVSLAVMLYVDLTDFLVTPGLGIVLVGVLGVGMAFGITALSTGLSDRRSLYASLTVAALGVALYYPVLYLWYYVDASWPIVLGLGLLAVLVGLGVGLAWGGPDRWTVARTAALTALPVAGLLFVDRLMSSWDNYVDHGLIRGRPISTASRRTPGFDSGFWLNTLDLFGHLLLPTLTLVLISFASYSRYSRASTLEVLGQDYIRTARAKGLTERTVIMRHAFRNALIPLASIVPVDIITLVGGAVITERIFNWRGMGWLFANYLDQNVIDPIMGYLLVIAILAVVANFVADLFYAVLDPRIRVAA
ncbi:ABC transporter permease subunit [Nocardioides sp. ChNu-153]|uniref:ABC transporter permease n=1 Tax=unclassified Nocardioides TaxID=2615069 RepID=UPI002405DD97|nr:MULTISPECIES: ABC transporter permease subunit [unclassified Nocardioides]MDF9716907.1 ABC transporter permease subunit [Nocardioides sp. ChNu-99]MDN7122625.1 ABC transporter permease subunit [Nocardioides sp. ChNu-153]